SREALSEALNDYTGAVVLVSHDMHLLGLVADRLWLVNEGQVTGYEGDLEDYRRFLLNGDQPSRPKPPEPVKPVAKRPARDELQSVKAEVRRAEERVQKLADMLKKLDLKLADPKIYRDAVEAEKWGRKHAEAKDAMRRAEDIWMNALENL